MTDPLAVDIEGRSISYRLAGRGTPLLLLHGVWSDTCLWHFPRAALADTQTVNAWDAYRCGAGASG